MQFALVYLFLSLLLIHFLHPLTPPGLFFVCVFDCEYWMSSWNDAIWLSPCSFSMVSTATVSSEWGHGSNWPIVSKLHFSEWFPLSCYWNRAPALWWIHLVIHSLEGKRGKYKHDTGGLALLKQRDYWMNKHTNGRATTLVCMLCTPYHPHLLVWSVNCTRIVKVKIHNELRELMKWWSSPHVPTPSCLLRPHKEHHITKTPSSLLHKHQAWRSLLCPNQSSLNPSARVQVLTLVLFFLLPPLVLREQPNAGASGEKQGKEGDKNTNDCDLLLIVFQWVEKRWKNTEWNPLQIELSLFETGVLQKKRKKERNTDSMTEAINENGTIIYSDLSERLISLH